MPNIALFGGAGVIGKSIAAACRAEKRPYRVIGRDMSSLEKAFPNDDFSELVTWNTDDPASVRAACRGIDTLVYLIGVPYNHFELHPILMRKTLDGAIAEGVKRFILIGTVYPYGRPETTPVDELHPRKPHTFKGQKRKEQEDILLEAHAKGKIQATILRLPDFYGPGVEASFLHSVFKAAAQGGTADMIAPIDKPHEFVYVPDVGPVVLKLEKQERAYGKWWNFAGSGVITQREAAEKAFRLTGRKVKLRIVSKGALRIIGIFKPFLRELVEMHYLLTTPVIMTDAALVDLLGDVHKTSYDEGIRQSLVAFSRT